jgi:hypothetical protein
LEPEISSREIRLLGVEAALLGLGQGLSEAVQAALPSLSEAIEQHVTSLLRA